MYSAEQALEQIWNDSGNEGDLFDSNESEFEMYKASKVTSSVLMPLHEGKIVHKTLRRAVLMRLRVLDMVEIQQIMFAKGRKTTTGSSSLSNGTWNTTT